MSNININGEITANIGSGLLTAEGAIQTILTRTARGVQTTGGALGIGEITINWGTVTPASSGTAVSFSVPYSSSIISIAGSNIDVANNQIRALAATNISPTGFTAYGQWSQSSSGLTNGDVTFKWIAIGR